MFIDVVGLSVCCFPIGIQGHVWYLIVSIPDLCTLTYFVAEARQQRNGSVVKAYWKSQASKSCVCFRFCGDLELRDRHERSGIADQWNGG